jgi:hypothetical protein
MGQLVCAGAMLKCSFGAAPAALAVLPVNGVMTGACDATIMDNKPMANVASFGVCISLSNPMVAAATAAAMGVLVPMPCIPMTTAPWAPGSATVMIGDVPALNNASKLMCAYGGVIAITMPGQTTVSIP